MTDHPRILDIVNTDHAALNFLVYRARWINEHTEFRNDIVCSAGPHLQHVRVDGSRVTTFDIPRGVSPTGMTRLLIQLIRHLRTQPYTIVHTHNSITGAVGRCAARIARVPLVVHTTHGFHFHENMGRLKRVPYVAAERCLARCCDLLLCQNREELRTIHRLNLMPRHGAYYVGNGINVEQFRPRSARRNNPRPVLLCVARLEPVKNHQMLFQALEILRRRFDVEVWLVGDGPSQPRYEADLRRRGLAASVRFLGYRYDMPELTAAADVAVLTSVKEGIPRALMQAMAVGVPVVATDVLGSREVVVEGKTGFLVPLNDADALADRVSLLLDSPDLRSRMGACGVEHVRRHFNEEHVVERLVGIYRSALEVHGLAYGYRRPTAVSELSQTEQTAA
jgi:glycosyltransferase involved in cell wall biosynthesis